MKIWLVCFVLVAAIGCARSPFGEPESSYDRFEFLTNDVQSESDGGILKAIEEVIDESTYALDCAFTELSESSVIQKIQSAKARGAKVRVAFDGDSYSADTGYQALKSAGFKEGYGSQAEIFYGNTGEGAMRHNFCMADERQIWISSSPVSSSQLTKRPQMALRIGTDIYGIGREFRSEMTLMQEGKFGNRKGKVDFNTKFTIFDQAVGIYWGPQEDPMEVLAGEVEDASSSVRFYSTSFLETSSKISLNLRDILNARAEKGISISGIFDSGAVFEEGSEVTTLNNYVTKKQLFNNITGPGLQAFVLDENTNEKKVLLYFGALRSKADSSDDSVILVLKGNFVVSTVARYLDKLSAQSIDISANGADIATANQHEVVINEILWQGSYTDAGVSQSTDEFIELYNTTSNSINISGWQINCGSTITIPGGALIPAKSYFVIADNRDGAIASAHYSVSSMGISNSTNQCTLTDGTANGSTVVDTAGDGVNGFDANYNKFYSRTGYNSLNTAVTGTGRRSMERINLSTDMDGTNLSNWQTNHLTAAENVYLAPGYRKYTFASPGAGHSTRASGTSLSAVITEIHYAGSDTNDLVTYTHYDDFFEIYNPGTTDLNIGQWQIGCTTQTDGSNVPTFVTLPFNATVPAGSFFVVTSQNDKAFTSGNYTEYFALSSATRECVLSDGLGSVIYSGETNLTGTVIDKAGTLSNTFAADSLGKEVSGERRSFERLDITSFGTTTAHWQTNIYTTTANPQVASNYNQTTFASPGVRLSSGISLSRNVYFTTNSSSQNGKGSVTFTYSDGNTTGAVDTITATLTSSSDSTGISLTLTETGASTGIFSGTFSFSTSASGSGAILVSSGDTITVSSNSYQDTAKWYEYPLVINEIGSNCGSQTANDYVEIYNPNSASVPLSGFYVNRDSNCLFSSGWDSEVPLSGNVAATSYYTVGDDTWTAGCSITPDNTTTNLVINGDDCIALTEGATSTPIAANATPVIDFVGFGSSSVFEAAAAPNMGGGNDQCISRISNGYDSDNNQNDFVTETTSTCSPGAANPAVPFNVTGASPASATSLSVTFNRAPLAGTGSTGSENPANYCIALTSDGDCSSPDLSVSAASLSSNTVTLTTSSQVSGTSYTVYVSNVLAAAGATALGTASATFNGFTAPAAVKISELNSNITNGCDLIELKVITGGDMNGIKVIEGGELSDTTLVSFSSFIVSTGDLIVVHLDSTDTVNCNTASVPGNETSSVSQYANGTYPENYDTAWDWWSTDTGLTNTDNVVLVTDSTGSSVQDAIAFSDNDGAAISGTARTDYCAIYNGVIWSNTGIVNCSTDASSILQGLAAQDNNALGTGASGTTYQRVRDSGGSYCDSSPGKAADFTQAASTWGSDSTTLGGACP